MLGENGGGGGLKLKAAAAAGVLFSLAAMACLVYATPSLDDFSLENPYWNGLSWLRDLGVVEASHGYEALTEPGLNPMGVVVLIIGPDKPYSLEEASTLRAFMEKGGLLVLMDDFGSGNTLLQALGVEARFNGAVLRDPLFKDRDSRLAKAVEFKVSQYTRNLTALQLNHATYIDVDGGFKGLAYTSPFSYVDLNGNGARDEGESYGPFPVVAEASYGLGGLILVSDSSLFINSMRTRESNLLFFQNLVEGRVILLDAYHWKPSALSEMRERTRQALDSMKGLEVRIAFIVLAFLASFKVRVNLKGFMGLRFEDEVLEVSRLHPEWDLEALRRLKELRDRVEG